MNWQIYQRLGLGLFFVAATEAAQPNRVSQYQSMSINIGNIPYTRVNKRIHLFPKLQGNMHLIPNMHLIMMAKIDYSPKTAMPFW